MKKMSVDAKTSRIYTNHCIRATTTRILATANVQRSDIKIVTGHKSEASLEPYITGALGATTGTKRKLSNILSKAVSTASSRAKKMVVEVEISDEEELEIIMTQEASIAEEDASLVQEANIAEEDASLDHEASVAEEDVSLDEVTKSAEEDFIISQCAESAEENEISVPSISSNLIRSTVERLFYNCNFNANVTINLNITKK